MSVGENHAENKKKRRPFGGAHKRCPEPGERFQIGIRLSWKTKMRLDATAEENGRSQSHEVEMRLERSFWIEDMLKAGLMTLNITEPPIDQAARQDSSASLSLCSCEE